MKVGTPVDHNVQESPHPQHRIPPPAFPDATAMTNTAVATPLAPAAIGPYSQAVRSGDLLFLSGQIPLDPASGKLVEGGIEAQTERVLLNLKAVLEAAGATLHSVVKTTVFLTDLNHFQAFNTVYGRHFASAPAPARATVQVAALPRGALVEIEAIARL
jgi:2-iminobutanoate/2-iminopropanoate deaminase